MSGAVFAAFVLFANLWLFAHPANWPNRWKRYTKHTAQPHHYSVGDCTLTPLV